MFGSNESKLLTVTYKKRSIQTNNHSAFIFWTHKSPSYTCTATVWNYSNIVLARQLNNDFNISLTLFKDSNLFITTETIRLF